MTLQVSIIAERISGQKPESSLIKSLLDTRKPCYRKDDRTMRPICIIIIIINEIYKARNSQVQQMLAYSV